MKAGRYCGTLLWASRHLEFLTPAGRISECFPNVFLGKVGVEPKNLSVPVAGGD
jgi:hypothetical protein